MAMSDQHRLDDLVARRETLTVEFVADGTLTRVEVYEGEDGGLIGSGASRRKKGDRRNLELGLALAAHRTFQGMADDYLAVAKEKGYVVEKPEKPGCRCPEPLALPAATGLGDVFAALAGVFAKKGVDGEA